MRASPITAVLAATLSLLACGSGDSAAERTFVVDTLPGGIIRTVSSAPAEPGRWQVTLERSIQPAEDSEGELLDPNELAITDDGHVLTFETGPMQVRVYGPDGAFLRAFGGKGKGPGEFSAGMIAVRGDTVAVQDPMNQRFSVWNWREGTLLSERRSACCYWSSLEIDGRGRAWVPRMGAYPDSAYTFARGYLLMPLGSDRADSVFAVERAGLPRPDGWVLRQGEQMMMSMSVPLQPGVYFAVDPTGGIVSGYTAEYSLRVSTDGVDTVALFGRSFTPQAVTGAEKTALVDARVRQYLEPGSPFDEAALRRAFDAAAIPDRRPAWDGVVVDRGGRRWVRLSSADTTRASFDLFDRDGRWLDTVHIPADLWPMQGFPRVAWGRDRIALTAEGEDGRPLVRVLAVQRR